MSKKKILKQDIKLGNKSIAVGGNAIDSTIINGDGNTIIQSPQLPDAQSSLFTISLPPTDFTGRANELAELISNIEQGVSISGVTGGGGIGKTALARLLAQKLADNYPDAQLEIDLQGASYSGQTPLTPIEAMRRILQPFYPDQKLPQNEDELKKQYTGTFSQKRVLLLLDNALDAAQVHPLLPSKPSAAIVTSRAYFSLGDFRLHPLRLGILKIENAEELLYSVAPRLKNEQKTDVVEIARKCGFLPLALRVAGAIFDCRPDWTIHILLQKLEDEHSRLISLKAYDDPDLDVQSSLGISYATLDNSMQRRFRALGIFPASFDLFALESVWNESREECDNALGRLLRMNLVEHDPKSFFPYKLHDLTRLYAEGELLERKDEAPAILMRHSSYYIQQGEKIQKVYDQLYLDIIKAIKSFDALWPHLQTARTRLSGNDLFWRQHITDEKLVNQLLSGFPDMLPQNINSDEMSLGDMMGLLKIRRGRYSIVEEKIHSDSIVVDKMMKNVDWGDQIVIAGIIRENQMILPRGDTILKPNDEILALVHGDQISRFDSLFGPK